MKKIILILLLLFTLIFSACSQSQELSEEEKRAQELEFLKEQSQKALEEKEKELESRDFTTSSSSTESNEEFNEEEFTEAPKPEESEEQSQEESSPQESSTSNNVDIDLVSVDLNFPSNFDLEDDDVEVEVRIETNGIPRGQGFLVEALASNTEGDEIVCQFIYEVGGNEDQCELDNFPKLGEYTIDVIADLRDNYKESDETNNVFLDEFELEED